MEYQVINDIKHYQDVVQKHGLGAEQIISGNFADDFYSKAWEITKSLKPHWFSYHIIECGGQLKLVHQRDIHWSKDILEAVSSKTRGGLELRQMSLVRHNLLQADTDQTFFWISPKKILNEDPEYPLTQINIAEKVSEEKVHVRQFQLDLDLKGSARIINQLSKRAVVNEDATLEQVLLEIGKRNGRVEDWEVIGEVELDAWNPKKEVFVAGGWKYLQAIKQGFYSKELERVHGDLLHQTLDYSTLQQYYPERGFFTSCGVIPLGSISTPSWCETCKVTGELRCKFCKKGLKALEASSHRCVC